MAELEIIALDEAGNELEAPQAGDTYVAKRDVSVEANISTTGNITVGGLVDGRDVAADGALAASATQPGDNISTLVNDAGYDPNIALASQIEAEAGVETTKTMTPLRVAQAISALGEGIKNNYYSLSYPTNTNDETEGYSALSLWLNANALVEEVYSCIDATTNLAVWQKITLTEDDLATVASSGNSDDLTEGSTNKLLTAFERLKLLYITVTQNVNLDTLETDVAVLSGLTDVDTGVIVYVGGGQANATELSEGTNVVDTTYVMGIQLNASCYYW